MQVLSESQIETLKSVLQELCTTEFPVPRSTIFQSFEVKTKSGIEKYRFERVISELIRDEKIIGYEVKVGRKGGIIKTEPIERVTVICSLGQYIGCMPKSQLVKLISSLNKH